MDTSLTSKKTKTRKAAGISGMIRPADILLTLFLIAGGLIFTWAAGFSSDPATSVRVTLDGKIYGTYTIGADQEIEIGNEDKYNHLSIHHGTVSMISANCTGQDCVRSGEISRPGETIVCLPNRLIVEIIGEGEGYDSIAK